MTPKGSRKRVKTSPSPVDSSAKLSGDGRDRSDSQSRGYNASWYPGSWSSIARVSKAAPVTEVARESISAAKSVASNVTNPSASLLDTPTKNRHPSIQLTRKAGASSRSLPADATTTRVNIASDGSASTTAAANTEDSRAVERAKPDKELPDESDTKPLEEPAKEQQVTPKADPSILHAGSAEGPEQSSGWLSWIYRPLTTSESPANVPESPQAVGNPLAENQMAEQGAQPTVNDHTAREEELRPEPEQTKDTAEVTPMSQKRSWLQMWYGTNTPNKQEGPPSTEFTISPSANFNSAEPPGTNMAPRDPPDEPAERTGGSPTPIGTTRSSGWSFWSKDPNKDGPSNKPQEGEAVEASKGPKSPSKHTALEPDTDSNIKITQKGSVKVKPPKDNRLKDGCGSTEDTATSMPSTEPRPADITASKQLQQILPNQVLPKFEETYAFEQSPSILQSLGRLLHYGKGPEVRHVSRVRDPLHVRRALAIGVHGYFPAPFIRSVLGQPTGTSIRFSKMAADAIRKYTESHGYSCDIEKIALEGEGRITERVDLLWKLLLNWMEEIRKADFVMFACHSQGVPVTIMLVAKLIQFGCLDGKRVGICAMAGVNLGPFPDYRSRWISGSAGELFEFALPFSKVSKEYEAALKCALEFGVRISYIGSIDDQLVSLESSLFSPVAHPYVYRAVFVDGRVHAPSFLSHLVGFALKLRNLGISDHGLIRELSTPLAGSLYSGEGHSRLYDDEAVYFMAIEFALETSSVADSALSVKRASSSVTPNPYILPFAMRGLLEEEYVRRELHDETMELLRQFDDWKPSSKVLKDVKFRLEGIRSKL
ncbi:hypothetical protein E8E15_006104 [Penicillium rubens]|uniref:Pc21g07210 protein n=2 Tax=Penicillium chrysogenum species complex TaxID=254878 RepID=B6HKE7_PENRW|nr:uncharacterized protein N7525_007192 [Penicillium rubens]KZN88468.1 Uncharacterized protein EN45_070430 [Penicillium chrysogenum]CAP95618.1 Pc21g07210 [Penicillium rubens Wisconsin 54-1255]KAF3028044.1 hypothetical protein E8E15_006104 [Penicillium rubens]KAJ5049416.1 hypothetical protein NUH16_007934 [Penicillium rubens]KAJ5828939.1 hypothetical protein N7525_007192 [Penicillium rubens]